MNRLPMQDTFKARERLNQDLQHIKEKLSQLRLTVYSMPCHLINLKESFVNVTIILEGHTF